MVSILVAVVGLLGSGAAAVWIADVLRRRDMRAALKTDLELYDKLPETGTARSVLMKDIERRIKEVSKPVRSKRARGTVLIVLVYIGLFEGSQALLGLHQWERHHSDGLMWVHNVPSRGATSYLTADQQIQKDLLLFGLGAVVPGVALGLALRRWDDRREKQREATRRESEKAKGPDADDSFTPQTNPPAAD